MKKFFRFFFAKIEPQLINEPETNKLNWKLAKSYWAVMLDVLKNYTPFGAKTEKILPIFKGNFILDNRTPLLDEENLEKLQEYSFVLYRLIRWIVDILNTRKSDILWRHANQRAYVSKFNNNVDNNSN